MKSIVSNTSNPQFQKNSALNMETSRKYPKSCSTQVNSPHKDFIIIPNMSQLGSGSYGTVVLVKDKMDQQLYAMKIISKKSIIKYKSLENLKREIKIHRKLSHKHIIKMNSCFEDAQNVYLILEYAQNGSLRSQINYKKRFTERQAFPIFLQISLGLEYLHKQNIIHRDLKLENILIDKEWNVKICDFGWSIANHNENRKQKCGTIEYMAPEIIKKQSHTYKVDIWSLGIILFELLHGETPFDGNDDHQTYYKISNQSLQSCEMNKELSSEVLSLIEEMLQKNPKNRPSMQDIFQHPWIQVMNNERKVETEELSTMRTSGREKKERVVVEEEDIGLMKRILISLGCLNR